MKMSKLVAFGSFGSPDGLGAEVPASVTLLDGEKYYSTDEVKEDAALRMRLPGRFGKDYAAETVRTVEGGFVFSDPTKHPRWSDLQDVYNNALVADDLVACPDGYAPMYHTGPDGKVRVMCDNTSQDQAKPTQPLPYTHIALGAAGGAAAILALRWLKVI